MVKAEEALDGKLNISEPPQTIHIWGHEFTEKQFDDLVESLRTPTFDEVVKAWEIAGFKETKPNYFKEIRFAKKNKGINFKRGSSGWYCTIHNYCVFTTEMINAINLTIRYLEGQKEKVNENIK